MEIHGKVHVQNRYSGILLYSNTVPVFLCTHTIWGAGRLQNMQPAPAAK